MTETLVHLAGRINELGKLAADAHMEFCRAIAEAEVRVHRETKLTFKEWAHKHLRRPNGKRWSWETIRTYARYGRVEGELDKKREYSRNYHRESSIARQQRAGITNTADEVNLLMTAWERASVTARHQFLQFINARLLPARGIQTRSRAA